QASDKVGRFTEFQGGTIFWSPGSGAHEVHGAIRDRWTALGRERSFLGYPISDEQEVSDGGRANAFEQGTIYWWQDVGPIELRGVVVSYSGLRCFGETDNDGFSDSDEPYVILGTIAPPVVAPAPAVSANSPTQTARTQIYENVDAGAVRADNVEIYRGQPN